MRDRQIESGSQPMRVGGRGRGGGGAGAGTGTGAMGGSRGRGRDRGGGRGRGGGGDGRPPRVVRGRPTVPRVPRSAEAVGQRTPRRAAAARSWRGGDSRRGEASPAAGRPGDGVAQLTIASAGPVGQHEGADGQDRENRRSGCRTPDGGASPISSRERPGCERSECERSECARPGRCRPVHEGSRRNDVCPAGHGPYAVASRASHKALRRSATAGQQP